MANTLSEQHGRSARFKSAWRHPAVIGVLVTFFVALLARELFLGLKVMHHDESLHAYYASLVVDGRPHVYSAMLHGPFIFYFGALWQMMFGFSDFVARQPVAILGTGAAVLVWFLPRRLFPFSAKCMLAAWLSLSPYFLYFSRFLRNDIFMILGLLLVILGIFSQRLHPKDPSGHSPHQDFPFSPDHWLQSQKIAAPLLMGLGVSLQFLSKENSYLHALLALCWIASASLVSQQTRAMVKSWMNLKTITLVLALIAFPFVLFYSSFFRHPQGSMSGVLDGLYRESLGYWWKEHRGHRIKGSFDYHFPILFHYEAGLIPLLLFKCWSDTRAVLRSMNFRRIKRVFDDAVHPSQPTFKTNAAATLFTFAIPIALLLVPLTPLPTTPWMGRLASTLHVTHVHHLILIAWLVAAGGFLFFGLHRIRRSCDAALWFWLVGCCGAYSYVGEKVPWLGIYIAFAALLVASRSVPLLWRGWRVKRLPGSFRTLLALTGSASLVLAAMGLWKSMRLNYVRPADPAERLVYTQTSQEVLSLPEQIALKRGDQGQKTGSAPFTINLSGSPVWPLAWYSRVWNWSPSFYAAKDLHAHDPDVVIFGEEEYAALPVQYHQSHTIQSVPLRTWWVPYAEPRATDLAVYFLKGKPYLPPGGPSELIDGVVSLSHTSFYIAVRKPAATLDGEGREP